MLLVSFLLCCLISFLTGTSFGSVATMGVICMTMAKSMGISTILEGGAILAGIYFGDRCFPVSTSALLVSELTGTDLFDNLKQMAKSAWISFGITCLIYGGLGLSGQGGEEGAVNTASCAMCTDSVSKAGKCEDHAGSQCHLCRNDQCSGTGIAGGGTAESCMERIYSEGRNGESADERRRNPVESAGDRSADSLVHRGSGTAGCDRSTDFECLCGVLSVSVATVEFCAGTVGDKNKACWAL